MTVAIRNDRTGLWDSIDLAEPLPPLPPVHQVHENGPYACRYKKDAFRDLLDGLGSFSSQMPNLYIDLGGKSFPEVETSPCLLSLFVRKCPSTSLM